MKDQIQLLTGVVRNLTDFLVSMAIVVLLVDILFPATGLSIVENIGAMVDGVSSDGLAGLVALLLFLMLYRQNNSAAPSAPPPSGNTPGF